MTEAEERDRIARQERDLDKLCDDLARSTERTLSFFKRSNLANNIAKTLAPSRAALAWCRDNPKLVEALAAGTWRAVPVIADQNMVAAIDTHHDSASNHGDTRWERALEAAPKKPVE